MMLSTIIFDKASTFLAISLMEFENRFKWKLNINQREEFNHCPFEYTVLKSAF